MLRALKRSSIVLTILLVLCGCAGTINYPEYAKAQVEVFKAKAEMRTALVQAYTDMLTKGTNPNAQLIAAIGLMMLMQKSDNVKLEAPQDQIVRALDIVAPFAGITAVTGYMGHYMSKLGAASTVTTTNTFNSTVGGSQNSMNTVPGDANTFTYHSDWEHRSETHSTTSP